jgi:hypothetical protein
MEHNKYMKIADSFLTILWYDITYNSITTACLHQTSPYTLNWKQQKRWSFLVTKYNDLVVYFDNNTMKLQHDAKIYIELHYTSGNVWAHFV